ncbi:hypothetical protein D3C80_1203880 [compost metagenome]
MYLQQTARVITHRLQLLNNLHILHSLIIHASEDTDPVSARGYHLSADRGSVNDDADPRLMLVIVGFSLNPQLRTPDIEFKCAACPEQRQGSQAPICSAVNLEMCNLLQGCGLQSPVLFHPLVPPGFLPRSTILA